MFWTFHLVELNQVQLFEFFQVHSFFILLMMFLFLIRYIVQDICFGKCLDNVHIVYTHLKIRKTVTLNHKVFYNFPQMKLNYFKS